MKSIRLLMIRLLPLLAIATTARGGEESLRERFLREYPDASARLLKFYRRDGSGKAVEVDKIVQAGRKDPLNSKTTYAFYISGDDVRVDEQRSVDSEMIRPIDRPDPKAEKVKMEKGSVSTNGRSFVVGRPESEKQFTLADMSKGASKAAQSRISFLVEAPFCIQTERISNLIHHPEYTIEDVTEEIVEGKPFARVQFRRVTPNKKSMTGWFRLDPNRSWLLDHYHIETDKPVFHDVSVFYKNGAGELPQIDHVVTEFKNPSTGLSRTSECVYEEFKSSQVSKQEFTPKAFGLPDVGKPASRNNPNYFAYVLIGLSVLALVGAMGTRYYATRKSSKAS